MTPTTAINFHVLKERVQHNLEKTLPANTLLDEAMRYSVLNGGKRLRPLLTYCTGQSFNTSLDDLDAAAMSVELIHCFSLIHDDLPAMDNDDLRRGQPTCHKQFNEATAILAGDALQSVAYQVLSQSHLPAKIKLQLIQTLSYATGHDGMVLGQVLDMQAENTACSIDDLKLIHSKKTGALIQASVIMGGQIAQCNNTELDVLNRFGAHLGLAFQIKDDLLELESDPLTLGKSNRSDENNNKSTFPLILGAQASKQQLQTTHQHALDALNNLNTNTTMLKQLLDWTLIRSC
jgi:farnesyl diphosphate synthase